MTADAVIRVSVTTTTRPTLLRSTATSRMTRTPVGRIHRVLPSIASGTAAMDSPVFLVTRRMSTAASPALLRSTATSRMTHTAIGSVHRVPPYTTSTTTVRRCAFVFPSAARMHALTPSFRKHLGGRSTLGRSAMTTRPNTLDRTMRSAPPSESCSHLSILSRLLERCTTLSRVLPHRHVLAPCLVGDGANPCFPSPVGCEKISMKKEPVGCLLTP
jgi:hypothetical protein